VYAVKVILIDITEHPDLGKVGNGKKIGGIIQGANACTAGYILFHKRAGNWGPKGNEGRRIAEIRP
jgi:hypothetical protein